MIKNQVASFLPIPESQSAKDLTLFSEFDSKDIGYLHDDYLHLPHEAATVALLDPTVTEREIDTIHRPAYEAGVVLGSIVGRTRLSDLGRRAEIPDIFSREAVSATNWRTMKLSRFALSQFHEDPEFIQHLRSEVELPWFIDHSIYSRESPSGNHPDWLAVGYGDLMRTIQVGEALLRRVDIPTPELKPIVE